MLEVGKYPLRQKKGLAVQGRAAGLHLMLVLSLKVIELQSEGEQANYT